MGIKKQREKKEEMKREELVWMKEENLLCSFFYARAKERKELGLLGPPHSNLELAAALRTNQVLSLLRSCAYASRPCLLRRGPL